MDLKTKFKFPQKLIDSIEHDIKREDGKPRKKWFHDYLAKAEWIQDRTLHYAEKLDLDPEKILSKWEELRTYWYMNYYQDSNQPLLKYGKVKVFDNVEDFSNAIDRKQGFRCPSCGKVSMDPYECTQSDCNWKVYGLFKDLGKGIYVFCKDEMYGNRIFMPVSWEKEFSEK